MAWCGSCPCCCCWQVWARVCVCVCVCVCVERCGWCAVRCSSAQMSKGRARTRVCRISDSRDVACQPLPHASFRKLFRGKISGMVLLANPYPMPTFENLTEGIARASCFSCPCCCCWQVWARVCVCVCLCVCACVCGKVWMVCCAVFKRTNVQREGSNPSL